MDPQRSNYSGESEPRWFRGDQHYAEQPQYADPAAHARFEPHADEGGYYGPDQRSAGRMPPQMGQAAAAAWPTEAPGPPPTTAHPDPRQYRSQSAPHEASRGADRAASSRRAGRRPALAAIITVITAVLALPVLRILINSAIGPPLSTSGVISAVLLLLALTLGALGLHGLASATAISRDTPATHIWLRPPVAYCTVALVLCLAAGLAAR